LVRNPLLKYTVMDIVKNANVYGSKYYKQYHFYKLLFLVYFELKKIDIDIKLPYSWYFYGDLPDAQTFEHVTGGSLGYYTPAQGMLPRIDQLPDLGIEEQIRKKIDYVVKNEYSKITSNGRFRKNYGDILLKATYDEAPFEFQRVFNRGLLQYVQKFKTEEGQSTLTVLSFDFTESNKIGRFLDELMVVYPENEMPEVYDLFLRWEDTVRLTILEDHSKVIEVIENFWEVFCGLLRIKKNVNVLPQVVEQWEKEYFSTILPEYELKLKKLRKTLLRNHFEANPVGKNTRDTVDNVMKLARDLALETQEAKGA